MAPKFRIQTKAQQLGCLFGSVGSVGSGLWGVCSLRSQSTRVHGVYVFLQCNVLYGSDNQGIDFDWEGLIS